MSTDLKIYTAAEVASVGFSNEEIEEELATITQEAYEAAKSGKTESVYYYYNPELNSLNEIVDRLEKLGYNAEVLKKTTSSPYIIVQWDNVTEAERNQEHEQPDN